MPDSTSFLNKIDLLAAKLLAEGRMLSPFALVQALLAVDGANRVRLARADGSGLSVAYVSPSTREGSTIEQAYSGLVSPAMRQLQDEAHATPAVGFWADGAKESGVIHAPPDQVGRIAEEQGKKHNQKAVLWFTEGNGNDVAHVLNVPDDDAARIHANMLKHGIEYKTVIPREKSSEVHVIDMGGELTPQIEAYAQEARAAHAKHFGDAHFLALKPL